MKGFSTLLVFAPVLSYFSTWILLGVSCIGIVLLTVIRFRKKRRWKLHVDGHVEPGFEKVAQVFRENVLSQQEQGGAFAVYYEGRLVVDLWGGYADHDALRLRKHDSISMFYSSTKAMTALVIAMLADRGLIDFDKPVAEYWPEFGKNGKDSIKVKTILSHRSGLIRILDKHELSLTRDDPHKLGELLADQEPLWEPDTGQGYQVLTFGLYVDQLVRRVDPKRRGLGEFFRDEISIPFDIDCYIGEPKSEHHRACRETRASFGFKHFFTTTIPTGIQFLRGAAYSILTYRSFHLLNYIGNPTDWKPRRLNDPHYRELPCGSSHGFGTARALAKLWGILGAGGEHDGKTLLSKGMVGYLNTPLSSEFDRVVLRPITYGPGTTLMTVGDDYNDAHSCFGHWGAGGQMAFCDPHLKLGWAYLTNYSNILHGFIVDHRYASLEKAMVDCLYKLKNKQSSQ